MWCHFATRSHTFDIASWALDIDPADALALRPAVWTVMSAMFAVTLMPHVPIPTTLFAVAAIVGPVWPDAMPWVATAANAVQIGLLGWVWWNPDLLVDPRDALPRALRWVRAIRPWRR